MVNQQVHLGHENGREGRVEDVQWVAKQRFRHPEWQPAQFMHTIEDGMQEEEDDGDADESVFHGLAGGGTQEDVGEAVEETEDGVHSVAASPVQISQAASACSCNIENPSKVLAPSAEARFISAVSLGL